MVNIILEICKKELKTRFGSKRVLLPLLIPIGIPILVFIPQIQEVMSQTEPESELVSVLLFLLIPTMVTTLVGITAFINEIRWKTIKSILVAPVSEGEILLGKSLACIVVGLLVEVFISGVILISVNQLNLSMTMLLFILGPLSVIFTNFIFILGVSRFPTIAEGGGAILLPMSGLLIIFSVLVVLKEFLQFELILAYVVLILVTLILIYVTFILAKKWFNRENLVLSI